MSHSLSLLDQAMDELRRAGREDLVARIQHERRRVTDPVCDVLVVGEFKKGKSALINALLNARVCAVDAIAATAVPAIVRYGPRLKVKIVEQNDQPERTVALADLGSLATDAFAEGTRQRIQSAVIELPRDLLAQGLVLIDTPGVNGGLTAAHAAATLRALSDADAVIFVTDAAQELSQPELEFLRQAAKLCPNIVCALAKTDFYPDWPRILELNTGHLRRAGIELEIFPLAAPLRHHGVRTGHEQTNLESGYPQLAAYLRRNVIGQKEALGLRAAAAAARDSLEQVASRLAAEHATLADPAGIRGLRERLTLAKQKASKLQGAAADWQHLLADRFSDMASNVDADLTRRLRELRDEAESRIEQMDPQSSWPEFQAWLQQRANEEVIEHFASVRAEADKVAAQVAERFDESTQELILYADLFPDTAPQQVEAKDAKFERLSLGQLAYVALRGSSGSVVITGMVGTFLSPLAGGAVVAVMPWLTPVAAVLAAVMARTSASAARDAQLRANRVEGTKRVRLYLEQVELVARKDSRDTVRRINQRLRNYLRARAAELGTSAQHNLEATAKAVKADQTSSRQRIEQIAAELKRIRTLIADLDELVNPRRLAGEGGDAT